MARPANAGRGRLWVLAAVLAATSFVGAAITWTEGRPSVDERPSALASAEGSVLLAGPIASAPSAYVAPKKVPKEVSVPRATAFLAAGVPQRVYIEALGIDAPVLSIVADGGSLDPPPDPQDLGWWAPGAHPGAARGSALITGHTVHDGGGALDDLETLEPGTEISVRTANGMIRYVAESVVVLDKDTIARRAQELFSQEVEGRLVLVTCEDWDGTGYRSNVVVTASPVT